MGDQLKYCIALYIFFILSHKAYSIRESTIYPLLSMHMYFYISQMQVIADIRNAGSNLSRFLETAGDLAECEGFNDSACLV